MAKNEDTLLREVEEELRRERMEQLWKQYGSYFVVMALAIIIGVGGYKFYQTRQIAAANTAGAAYEIASNLVQDGKRDDARKAFDELIKSGPSGYAALARLKLAGLEIAAGEKAKALAHYEALASSGNADALLRSFARLQAAALKVGEADFTEVENRLNDLAGESSPWRANARELIALAALKAGKTDTARKALENVMADRAAPADVRERAQILMSEIVAADLAKKAAAPEAKPAADAKPAQDAAGQKPAAAPAQK